MNKQTLAICQSKQFWYKKFEIQNLPIDWIEKDLSLSGWIKQYNKLLFAKNYSHHLIELFKYLHHKYPDDYFSIFTYSKHMGNYTKIFPNHIQKLNKLKKYKKNKIILKISNMYYILDYLKIISIVYFLICKMIKEMM